MGRRERRTILFHFCFLQSNPSPPPCLFPHLFSLIPYHSSPIATLFPTPIHRSLSVVHFLLFPFAIPYPPFPYSLSSFLRSLFPYSFSHISYPLLPIPYPSFPLSLSPFPRSLSPISYPLLPIPYPCSLIPCPPFPLSLFSYSLSSFPQSLFPYPIFPIPYPLFL